MLSTNVSVGNVTINSGASINLQSHTLSVCGNWAGAASGVSTVSGAAGTGILIMSGSAIQTISGSNNFSELQIANTSGVAGAVALAVGANVAVLNALDLKQGNFNVSNGTFTFLSTSTTQSAILDNFSTGNNGTITGPVKAQRYYAASGYAYTRQHMLGSPVSGITLSQLGAGSSSGYVSPQADCDEYAMGANSPYGNVFSLDQSHGATCGMAQWYVEPGAASSNSGQGYSVVLPGSGVLTLTGSPNVTPSYTFNSLANSGWINTTAENHTLTAGWYLMSNPYLATLVLNTANTGIDGQVQIWESTGGYSGSYQPGNLGSIAIAPFQAFMVHVSNPGMANYTINGSDRARNTPSRFYSQNANELDIVAENLGNNLLDKTVVAFNSAATDSFDTQYDADKIAGSQGRHNLYTTLSNGKWMGINTLNSVTTTNTVSVGFEPGVSANYSFTFGNVNTFDPTTYIYLEDLQQQVMFNVRSGNYLFSADSGEDRNRFVLHFTPPVVINALDATCGTLGNINITQPGTANWTYTLADGNNTIISNGALNQNMPLNINAQPGAYTLTLTDNNGYTVTKIIQVNGAQATSAAFNPSNTTVAAQTQLAFTNTSQNANTFNWNFGDGTASSLVSPVHTYSLPGVYTVELTATNTTGCTATTTQAITVTSNATAINTLTENGISLWSNKNDVYIDFSNTGNNVDALIKIYDVLGQEISEDKFTLNGLYKKEIDNVEAAYVIVAVKNNDKITTKKLLINNIVK